MLKTCRLAPELSEQTQASRTTPGPPQRTLLYLSILTEHVIYIIHHDHEW